MTRRGLIWKPSDQEFKVIVSESRTFGEVLRRLGIVNLGSSYYTLRKRIDELGVSTQHFQPPTVGLLKPQPRPLMELLRKGVRTNNTRLKARLVSSGLLINRCSICGLEPIWRTQPLVLILDHIDGDNTNYEIANLRLVCPNCNSQLSTFGSRNFKGRHSRKCLGCGGHVSKGSRSGNCRRCSHAG